LLLNYMVTVQKCERFLTLPIEKNSIVNSVLKTLKHKTSIPIGALYVSMMINLPMSQ
jgi:hypothetical protein